MGCRGFRADFIFILILAAVSDLGYIAGRYFN